MTFVIICHLTWIDMIEFGMEYKGSGGTIKRLPRTMRYIVSDKMFWVSNFKNFLEEADGAW